MTILGKKQMSEEDIKLNYITPVILKGWKGHITMETKITDGRNNAFCGLQRSLMRFPAVAVRSITAAGKQAVTRG